MRVHAVSPMPVQEQIPIRNSICESMREAQLRREIASVINNLSKQHEENAVLHQEIAFLTECNLRLSASEEQLQAKLDLALALLQRGEFNTSPPSHPNQKIRSWLNRNFHLFLPPIHKKLLSLPLPTLPPSKPEASSQQQGVIETNAETSSVSRKRDRNSSCGPSTIVDSDVTDSESDDPPHTLNSGRLPPPIILNDKRRVIGQNFIQSLKKNFDYICRNFRKSLRLQLSD